ncbi:MAG: transposase [Gammaproteobacteria bacterium]|nr:transposase [Gammaproteobacteria bacterium]
MSLLHNFYGQGTRPVNTFSIYVACSMPVVFDWNSTGEQAMELAQAQYERIALLLPRQRGNVGLSNHQAISAILCVAGHGCKWRCLPERFGSRHAICTRMNRWSKNGVLDRCSSTCSGSRRSGSGSRPWVSTAPASRYIPTARAP